MNDGRFGPPPVLYPPAPGIWRPTPPNFANDPAPWVGNVRPFIVPSVEMLRTDGPNALTSAEYAEDFNEIKEVGSLTSTTRTADQTDAAIFWQDQAMALWNRIFRTLAANQNLDIVDSARFFAMENLAAADALIGCWNDKYYWQFWRPIAAIRAADTDGNPATQADPTWLPLFDPSIPVCNPPLLFTPPFPDHPSGHASATAAFTHTLKNFFGTDRIAFSAFSNKSCTDAELRPLLGRGQGGHRRSSVGRHPLSHRRRAGLRARQESRPLHAAALLPPGPMTLQQKASRRNF